MIFIGMPFRNASSQIRKKFRNIKSGCEDFFEDCIFAVTVVFSVKLFFPLMMMMMIGSGGLILVFLEHHEIRVPFIIKKVMEFF